MQLFLSSSRRIQLIAGSQKRVFVVKSGLSKPGECFFLLVAAHVGSHAWVVASNLNFSEDMVDGVPGSKNSMREAIILNCLGCPIHFRSRVAVGDAMHSLDGNVHLEENSVVVVQADSNLVGSELARHLGQGTLSDGFRSLRSTAVASMSKKMVWRRAGTGHGLRVGGPSRMLASREGIVIAARMESRGRRVERSVHGRVKLRKVSLKCRLGRSVREMGCHAAIVDSKCRGQWCRQFILIPSLGQTRRTHRAIVVELVRHHRERSHGVSVCWRRNVRGA